MNRARDRAGVGPIRGAGGRMLSAIYGAAVARRNARFDTGRSVKRAPVPVICVGNLSAGGVGKTPMVRHVVGVLREAGRRPAVVLRGYKSEPGKPSDEQVEHTESLPGVPVAADPNRRRAITRLLASREGQSVDCVVLDDGFQHRRLARDLDIVLLDAANDPWRDRLLPSGWLREPPGSLRRAGAVVITHAERVTNARLEDLDDRVRRERGEGAAAVTEHYWKGLTVQPNSTAPERPEPESYLAGKRVFALCAIGSPEGFFEQAHRVGALVVGELALRDHDAFRETTVAGNIRRARTTGAEVVACTAKDWTKLRRVEPARWPCPVARPTLGLRFVRGEDGLRRLVLDAAGPATDRASRPAAARRAPASV